MPPVQTAKATNPVTTILAVLGTFLVTGIALLAFYVFQAPALTRTALRDPVFYLILSVWAVVPAIALFGILKSAARYRGQSAGHVLEVSGPAVVFLLMMLGGMWTISAKRTIDVTVRAHAVGANDSIIRHGQVTLDAGTLRRTVQFDFEGEANFKQITTDLLGDTVVLTPLVDGYEARRYKMELAAVIDLPLTRRPPTRINLGGTLVAPNDMREYTITVDGQDGAAVPDRLGRFSMLVVGDTDVVRVRVHRGAQLVYDEWQTLSGPLDLKVEDKM
jgi:hypothetical protein